MVKDGVRGKWVGSQLLMEAERMARELGAKNSALETFEWQAPRSYPRHGYEEKTQKNKNVGEFYHAIMRKAL